MGRNLNLPAGRQGKPNVKLALKLTQKILQTLVRILSAFGKPLYRLLTGTIIALLFITYLLERLIRSLVTGIFTLTLRFIAFFGHGGIVLNSLYLSVMKLPRAYARSIFSLRFVGSKIPPKRKHLRFHPRAYVRGFSRRGIKLLRDLVLIQKRPHVVYPEPKARRLRLYLAKIKLAKFKVKIPSIIFDKPKGVLTLVALKLKLALVKISKVKIRLPKIRIKPIAVALTLLLGILILVFSTWWFVFRDLPSPSQLITRDLEVSTKIYDREGYLLYKIYKDKNRTLVPLEEIPMEVRLATIAIEDAEFYSHPGFSVKGIVRAIISNLKRGELAGGSTITQQLVKNALLSSEKTLVRKLKEIVLAIAVELNFSKDQILEMYLNEVSYGGTAYGIQEASRVYFAKDVNKLSIAEASLLAGLPKSPTRFSPFGPNPELARQRQKEVVNLMVINGFISRKQAEEVLNYELKFAANKVDIEAPHFVMYIRELLAEEFAGEFVETEGLEVYTTLDFSIQRLAETVIAEEIEKIRNLNVTNGAALVLNPKTGEILAMVGSKNYFDTEADGNVNVTVRPRQPGSAIKIVNYAFALANGFTPATILADTPITFSMPGQPPYSPKNYDGGFRGNLSLRSALAESRNVPAVKVLATYGVNNMIEMGQKMGITTWNDTSRFGLSLTLGGGEVKLIDLARAYATVANYGKRPQLNSISKVTNYKEKVLLKNECLVSSEFDQAQNVALAESDIEAATKINCEGEQVLDPRVAYLLIDILKDNSARAPAFGSFSQLVIPGHSEVSVKTGTSNDLRDNLTIGFNQDYLVAVWVGNNDNSPMARVASGVTGASPIFNKIMSALLAEKPNHDWLIPEGLSQIPICTLTGTLPCESCPVKIEWFLEESKPNQTCSPESINKFVSKEASGPEDFWPRDGQVLEPAARTER